VSSEDGLKVVRTELGQGTAGARCDFCGAPLTTSERQRFVWNTGLGTELVLAELCGTCAARADLLLEMYGGRGRDSIRLTQWSRVSAPAPEPAPLRRGAGIVIRGLLYVLIALASFLIYTYVSSHR